MKWKPIDTAPKDGTYVLVGQWMVDYEGPYFRMGVSWWSEQWGWGGNVPDEPTHWMPLPPPPGEGETP